MRTKFSLWLLLLLAALYLGVAATYSLNTPLFEGSDEPAHFEYVAALARGETLPLFHVSPSERGNYESHQPPLYYALSALAVRAFAPGDYAVALQRNPHTAYDPLEPTNKNLFLHTRAEDFPFTETARAVHVARAVSILFGLGALLATFALARTLFPAQPALWFGAAAVVGFLPQFAFSSGVVSNDSAATMMSAVALWQLARVAVRFASASPLGVARDWSFVWLGVWLALAPLAKESDLVVVPLALLALALLAWRANAALRRTLVRGTLVTAVVFVALVGWWYVLRYMALGFWFGTTDSAVLPDVTPSIEGITSQWTELEISFWGLFGWNIVPLPQVVYDALHWLSVVALGGVLLTFARRAYTTIERTSLLGLSLFALAVLGAFVRWMSVTGQAHGRLLFPALPAFAVVCCVG
ncbi:MAG: hypothetical protein LC737_07380, partial [Chloroflexi bacterium]|nr:hypothetical protein [Chloroflexota bacterium]